ncbi:apovitellenin-1 isoform X2 [Microcaecilia unicolor]|uniref:Apovitellenin-1 n=1 Tax=Microcaecilia unicolor TaxID=1415580 RepID=A0A6P7Y9R8_9AMPH|nr:apovitellenin-1-like isoform X2 [Microcaecilia unicolor]
MQSRVLLVGFMTLLLGMALSEGARTISKRHTQIEWTIIPDTIGLYLYEGANKISPEFGQFLLDVSEKLELQKIRASVTEKTSQLMYRVGDLFSKVVSFWEDAEKSES